MVASSPCAPSASFLLLFMPDDDSAYVTACQNGDLGAFDELYRRYIGPIYGYVYRRTFDRAAAEDITSTAFLKALERIETFDASRGHFSSWLYAIARNAIVDHFRAAHPSANIDDAWDIADDRTPVDDAAMRESIALVKDALQDLTKQQRDVVLLRLWEGLSYAEIADLLSLSEGNSKVIFHRAMKSLKHALPPSALALLLLFPHLP